MTTIEIIERSEFWIVINGQEFGPYESYAEAHNRLNNLFSEMGVNLADYQISNN